MTAYTVQQKSQLARLMATENLSIQHQKIQTAKFDPIGRVLYLPVWQDMTSFTYDLLTGHEVGHALFTPAEGWHSVATDKEKGRNYKAFVNVIEDARIEKKIIRKYPGLRGSFRKAYDELLGRDFFGLKGRDINKMAFINRLNIYTKSQYTQDIKFNREETILLGKVQMAETWDDVIKLADEIYEYSKTEQYEMMRIELEFGNEGDVDSDSDVMEMDFDGDENGDDADFKPSDKKPEPPKESGEEKEAKSSTDGTGDDAPEESDEGTTLDRKKESHESQSDLEHFEPTCETDDNYRENESLLLDETCKDYIYVTTPKPNLQNLVTPAKRVQELLSTFFNGEISDARLNEETANKWVREFRSKNERYVSLLAKEFEMRKAAKSFSKQKQSDTGDIDITKLASYRFDDNIFRKVMNVPKGKSHGLILLLDYSGSMSDNMAGSIEQILVLSMFCRKVNIPFHVYSFSNDSSSWYIDNNENYHTTIRPKTFSSEENELQFENIQLREYLNSKMSNSEFTKALRNMVLLKMSYTGGRYARPVARPPSEKMSNTPLTEAIVATRELMIQFRKVNNLDITNLVIVNDGDADGIYSMYMKDTSQYYSVGGQNVILEDKQFKYQKKMEHSNYSDPTFNTVLDWFSKTTNSKVFGFFIVLPNQIGRVVTNKYYGPDGKDLYTMRNENFTEAETIRREVTKQMQREKFLVSKNPGYDSFFMISGGQELSTDDDDMEIEGTITSSKLRKAFMTYNKGKQLNRVLVSKFIQGIAV